MEQEQEQEQEQQQQQQLFIEHEENERSLFHVIFYEDRTINIMIFLNLCIPLSFLGIMIWFIITHLV